jgi:hypothetical protein
MTARKIKRTKKPAEQPARAHEMPSRIRNSEVVDRASQRAEIVEAGNADEESAQEAPDLELPPPRPHAVHHAGTLGAIDDDERLPVVEPGAPVEPEDLGVQFLRDATEQNNFESHASREEDPAVVILPHVVISDATLDASMQEGEEWLDNDGTSGRGAEAPGEEPFQPELDLTQSTISGASLFDQVVPDDELDESEGEDAPVEGTTVQPTLHTEDPSELEEAREQEIRRVRHELLKKRQHAEQVTPRNQK